MSRSRLEGESRAVEMIPGGTWKTACGMMSGADARRLAVTAMCAAPALSTVSEVSVHGLSACSMRASISSARG